MIRFAKARAARKRYRELAPVLNEQGLRRFVALEAQALGRGGVSLMARISGLARSTIYHRLSDIRDNVSAPAGRIRKEGGGRKKKASEDPTLVADLKRLVEPVTRGDPMQPLLWTTRSLRNLANELANKEHTACPTVVGNLLRVMGYSLQANSKTREGGQHISRDAQFNYISTQAKAFLAANEPEITLLHLSGWMAVWWSRVSQFNRIQGARRSLITLCRVGSFPGRALWSSYDPPCRNHPCALHHQRRTGSGAALHLSADHRHIIGHGATGESGAQEGGLP
jgi:Rhodopirellula transposase DDE domain